MTFKVHSKLELMTLCAQSAPTLAALAAFANATLVLPESSARHENQLINSHLIPSACCIVNEQFLVLVEFHESCVTVSGAHSFSLLSARQCLAIFVEFQQKFKANEPYVG